MAISKTARTLRASASVAAGATANCTELDLSAKSSAIINVLLTNGASAPTTAPVVNIYTGEATGKKTVLFYTQSGDTANNSVKPVVCRIPKAAMFVNVDIIGGATNAITAEAYAQELTTE
jgi:hypothetical protein